MFILAGSFGEARVQSQPKRTFRGDDLYRGEQGCPQMTVFIMWVFGSARFIVGERVLKVRISDRYKMHT